MKWILILTSVFLSANGQIFMKWGVQSPKPLFPVKQEFLLFVSWPVLLGIFLYGLSTITWIFALQKSELSTAYPMVSLSYVFIIVVSYFLFNEPISVFKWTGAALICLGVFLISRS